MVKGVDQEVGSHEIGKMTEVYTHNLSQHSRDREKKLGQGENLLRLFGHLKMPQYICAGQTVFENDRLSPTTCPPPFCAIAQGAASGRTLRNLFFGGAVA